MLQTTEDVIDEHVFNAGDNLGKVLIRDTRQVIIDCFEITFPQNIGNHPNGSKRVENECELTFKKTIISLLYLEILK